MYNAFNQLTSATNPESNLIAYTYDNDGNVYTKTSYAENQTNGTPTYATGSVSISLSKYCQEGDCTSGTATITVGSYGAQVSYTQNENTSSLASALVSQLVFLFSRYGHGQRQHREHHQQDIRARRQLLAHDECHRE